MTETIPENELQEVILVEEEEKSPAVPEENPNLKKWTQGVDLMGFAGGLAGGFAAGFVPKVLKWDTGIKDVLVSGGVTVLGGLLIGKWNKQAAMGWVIGGGIITIVKGLRMFLGEQSPLLGSVGADNLIYDVGSMGRWYDGVGYDAEEDIFSQEELYGIGDDDIIPSADVDW